MKYFILKITEKPGHGKMGYTHCQLHSLGRRDDRIYLHESLNGSIKSVLGKFLNTTIQPEACFVAVSWNAESQENFSAITQLGLTLK